MNCKVPFSKEMKEREREKKTAQSLSHTHMHAETHSVTKILWWFYNRYYTHIWEQDEKSDENGCKKSYYTQWNNKIIIIKTN